MEEGKITTILLANIGVDCFLDMLDTKVAIVGAMNPVFFHAPPPVLLDAANRFFKKPASSRVAEKDRADFCTFLACAGDFSKRENEYYNKTWLFTKELGSVLLFTRNGEYVEELFRGYEGKLTKKELVDLLTKRGFRNILIMDTSCSTPKGTPETIKAFEEYGAYGGKRKKNRTKRIKRSFI